jgi:hypothetical protein
MYDRAIPAPSASASSFDYNRFLAQEDGGIQTSSFRLKVVLNTPNHEAGRHVQCLCQQPQSCDGRRILSTLDQRDVGSMATTCKGKLFLRELRPHPQVSYHSAESPLKVGRRHTRKNEALQSKALQHI